ncbi:MAG: type I-B CRISPR-associated protein Cas7/Csh2 [Clostridia bacterium]|nr:type I-B CRISPR-associated protein Cas7/Csh2 [Clostridia bacterium]
MKAEGKLNNSEILFIYDAKLCNPNGDPDDENRPRMDYERGRNLVSDVRLKRYIRDYFQDCFEADPTKGIFVSKVEGKTVNATERLRALLGKQAGPSDIPRILESLIDVRLFGATMPIKGEGGRGGTSIRFTGPVQFNWGYSLNRAELVDSSSITSHFAAEEGKEQGTIGKDYRVYFSLIGFHGIISGIRAQETNLTMEDIHLLDQAMIKAIPLQATRSKIGQYPRLYIRVEYNDALSIIGDFRDLVHLQETEGLRDITECELVVDDLLNQLSAKSDAIKQIYFWHDEKLALSYQGKRGRLEELVGGELEGKLVRLS